MFPLASSTLFTHLWIFEAIMIAHCTQWCPFNPI